jgi:hypothetical protein
MGVGFTMVRGGLACMVHGVLPFLFVTTGSRAIRALAQRLSPANRAKPANSEISAALESLTCAAL